jgi:hypothetical protein
MYLPAQLVNYRTLALGSGESHAVTYLKKEAATLSNVAASLRQGELIS